MDEILRLINENAMLIGIGTAAVLIIISWIVSKQGMKNSMKTLVHYIVHDDSCFDFDQAKRKLEIKIRDEVLNIKSMRSIVKASIEDLKNLSPISVILAFLSMLFSIMLKITGDPSNNDYDAAFLLFLLGLLYPMTIFFGAKLVLNIRYVRKLVIFQELILEIENDLKQAEELAKKAKASDEEKLQMKVAIEHLGFLVDTYIMKNGNHTDLQRKKLP